MPAAVTAANYKLFRNPQSVTEFKEFSERTHWTIAQDGWEEVADFALDWAVKNATISAVDNAAALA